VRRTLTNTRYYASSYANCNSAANSPHCTADPELEQAATAVAKLYWREI